MNFKSEMLLNSLLATDSVNLGFIDLIIGLILPMVLSFVVTFVYMKIQKTNNYNKNFIISIFIFAILTSVITMIIGGNLARAFGLIGALSIIRFRNALKDTMDAMFIFWALSIGMASGAGFFLASIVLTLVVAVFVLIMNRTSYGENEGTYSLIKVEVNKEVLSDKRKLAAIHTSVDKLNKIRKDNVLFDSAKPVATLVYSCKVKDLALLAQVCENLKETNEDVVDVHYLNNEFFTFLDGK